MGTRLLKGILSRDEMDISASLVDSTWKYFVLSFELWFYKCTIYCIFWDKYVSLDMVHDEVLVCGFIIRLDRCINESFVWQCCTLTSADIKCSLRS